MKKNRNSATLLAIAAALLAGTQARAQSAITLADAVNEALTKNLDLAAEKYNVSVAEAKRITAGLRPNPVLTVSGQTLNVFNTNFSANSPLGPNMLVVHTDVPLERGGKRQQRVEVAKADVTLAELGVRELMRQVIFGVQSAYVDVQQAKQNLALATDNQRRLDDLVAINEVRVRNGDLAQVELDRSRGAAAQAKFYVQQAQLQLDQAKTSLQLLLGRKDRTDAFDVDGTLRRDVVMATLPEMRDQALERRPDVLLASGDQARSTADLRLQLANGKVDYVVGTEYVRQSAYGIGGPMMGFYFSMPIQLFNRNQGEIARAQRQRDQSAAKIDALRTSVGAEVEKAYRQYQTSKQMLDSIEAGVLDRAKSVRDTTEYAYQRGEASLIEFLDAQRAYNEATQTYNDARAAYARSLYLLDAVSAATVSVS